MHKKDVAKKMGRRDRVKEAYEARHGKLMPHERITRDARRAVRSTLMGQKGKGSLNRASGKNEGDNMSLGRKGDEEARA